MAKITIALPLNHVLITTNHDFLPHFPVLLDLCLIDRNPQEITSFLLLNSDLRSIQLSKENMIAN